MRFSVRSRPLVRALGPGQHHFIVQPVVVGDQHIQPVSCKPSSPAGPPDHTSVEGYHLDHHVHETLYVLAGLLKVVASSARGAYGADCPLQLLVAGARLFELLGAGP